MDLVERNSLDLISAVEAEPNTVQTKSLLCDYIRNAEESQSWLFLQKTSEIFVGSKCINSNRKLEFSDLSGKLVLLDFFTYCCINCIHIMPFLHKLESRISMSDGLIMIGVHSAKFPNEKGKENIRNAIARHNLQHPVLDDSDIIIWDEFSVKCWPTLVVISPSGKVLFSIPGESHTNFIDLFIDVAREFFASRKELDTNPVTFSLEKQNPMPGDILSGISKLSFPGKVAVDHAGEKIAISDSGNHRIIISNSKSDVLLVIGGSGFGYVDGSFEKAKFDFPQGVAWYGKNTLFVADCNNHAIRKIDFLVNKVVTVCGTGIQGNDLEGGGAGLEQPISSPWDLVVGGSPRVPDGKSILYIAMSGCHQIWAFFLQTTDYQKGAVLEMGTCIRYAGNGNEENRNNSYPHKAGFAQPSGLALDEVGHAVYIADSESSTIRKMILSNGAVQALVGGDIDPMNLFAFGDVDGKAREAKLQHPVGVCWNHKKNLLYVADTYNHKIKIIDPKKKTCFTMEGLEDKNGKSILNEPGGISFDPSCENLYIADTNHHDIKVVSMTDYSVKSLALKFKSYYESLSLEEHDGPSLFEITKPITRKNTAVKQLNTRLVPGDQKLFMTLAHPKFILSPDSPSLWQISCFEGKASEDASFVRISSGTFQSEGGAEVSVTASQITHLLKSEECQGDNARVNLCIEAVLYYCLKDSGICKMHNYRAHLPLEFPKELEQDGSSADLYIEIC